MKGFPEKSRGRQVYLSHITHRNLMIFKLENNYPSVSEAVDDLIKNFPSPTRLKFDNGVEKT